MRESPLHNNYNPTSFDTTQKEIILRKPNDNVWPLFQQMSTSNLSTHSPSFPAKVKISTPNFKSFVTYTTPNMQQSTLKILQTINAQPYFHSLTNRNMETREKLSERTNFVSDEQPIVYSKTNTNDNNSKF